ncbi:MAG TPA: hypothetical protein DIW47_09400 [Bacteroidetes bacterium]|nr:hypothetical protein [Bacteroidota bacterium]
MKHLLQKLGTVVLSATLVFVTCALSAQNYLIKENFETFPGHLNGTSANGWTAVSISGDTAVDRWQFNNTIGYDVPSPLTGKVALADAYMGGYPNTGSNNTNTQDLALISPSVSTAGLGNLTLTWDELYMQLNSSSIYVEVSTDGGTNWTTVYSTSTGSFFSASRTVNLSGYTGNANFQVRFRWTKPGSTTHGYWMIDNVKLFSRYANDVGVETLIDPKNNSCPDPNQSLSLRITNFGTSSANGISVNMGVSGGTSGNFSTTITTLGAGASVNVFTGNTINTTAGGNFNFTAYTTYGSDQTTTNDTLITTVVTAPTPTDPSGSPIVRCGIGPVSLTANAVTGEETVWYDDSLTASALGSGNPFEYSNTVYASRRFYAENTRNLPSQHSTGLTGVYRYNTTSEKAIFFDLSATNEVVIDSFASNFAYNGRYICSIYYRSGSYYGYQTQQSAFTLLNIDTVDAISLGQPTYISLGANKLRIGEGQTYGFAITSRAAPGSSSGIPAYAFKLGITTNISNADMAINASDVAETAWSNNLYGYSADVFVFYQKVCKSQRKGIDVVIIPRPSGVELIEGNPKKGLYRTGNLSDPDVVRLNDTLAYELQPPTGFNNGNFGSAWMVTDLVVSTLSGGAVNSSDTFTVSPGANNGMFRYTPTVGVDSIIMVRVTVLNTSTMCDTTVSRYILVAGDPVARFNAGAICEGDMATFTNQSTIASGFLTYKWYFGDGDSSTNPSPTHTYAQAGSYDVRLIATSNYGFSSVFDSSIQVFEIPLANFTVPNECDGGTHQFTDASYIPSIGTPVFTWDFADGSAVSNAQNPTHMYTATGTYLVNLHVNVNGCTNSKSKYVTLAPRSVPDFNVSTSCNDKEVGFINTSTLAFGTFGSKWKFGDGGVSTNPNPDHVYSSFGSVDVTLITTSDLGCVDSVTKNISLLESPRADFSLSSTCTEEAIQVTNLTNIPQPGSNGYAWDFGNGQTSTLDNPVISYSGPGTYTITLSATSTNGCSDFTTRIITIDTKPIAGFQAADVCDGTPVSFTNNSINTTSGIVYVWEFGDGRFSSAKDTSLLYAGVGAYDVNLYALTQNGCSDTANKTILVNELPSAVFTVQSALTGDGQMVFLGPVGSGYSYQWFLGDGGKSTIQGFTHTYTAAGNYVVQLIVTTDKGCSSSSTQSISITPTGIEPIGEAVSIYPNPTTGTIFVDLSEISEPALELVLRDVQGKVLYRAQESGGTVVSLDLKEYPGGMYLIEVLGSGIRSATKITLVN